MSERCVFMAAREPRYARCTAEQRETLADALGDAPETVIAVHALRRGFCRAYASGAAAIVQWDEQPGEPMGFGDDAAALWDLLQSVDGWFCFEVTSTCSATLGPLIAADLPLLDAAPHEIQGGGFGSTRALLKEGIAAGAIVDGVLVAIAHTSALTPRHADISVATLAGWRGRGFATVAAALVAQQVQATGCTPVWSTGEDNFASQRVAQKLGFAEVGRRVYVIVEA